MAAAGEGVLFGLGLGTGEGERLRPRELEGEAGRLATGDVNRLSFCSSTQDGREGEEGEQRSQNLLILSLSVLACSVLIR